MRSSTALPTRRGPVAAEIEKYLASDLLFYRAERSGAACANARRGIGIRSWPGRATRLARDFKLGEGVIHVAQPDAALTGRRRRDPRRSVAARRAACRDDAHRLGADRARVAARRNFGRAAWLAAHVDEDWNMEQWGRDEMALERRAFRFAEFQAAAIVLELLAAEQIRPGCARANPYRIGPCRPARAPARRIALSLAGAIPLGFPQRLRPYVAQHAACRLSPRSRSCGAPAPAAGGGGR